LPNSIHFCVASNTRCDCRKTKSSLFKAVVTVKSFNSKDTIADNAVKEKYLVVQQCTAP